MLIRLIWSAFNAYNLKILLGPNITLAKIVTKGLFWIIFTNYFLCTKNRLKELTQPSPMKKKMEAFCS